jgi:hypothetical protein
MELGKPCVRVYLTTIIHTHNTHTHTHTQEQHQDGLRLLSVRSHVPHRHRVEIVLVELGGSQLRGYAVVLPFYCLCLVAIN